MQLSAFLLDWFDENKRELPFRKNRSLYSIWVSEVMLQQTKVDTVIPYFNSRMKKYGFIGGEYNGTFIKNYGYSMALMKVLRNLNLK